MNNFLTYCLLVMISYVTSSPQSYCLPIQPIMQDRQVQPQPEINLQGRPGRIGPIGPSGPAGPHGLPGIPGRCACEPSEIEQLRTENQKINVKKCTVGVQDNRIPDKAMTASSSYQGDVFQAYYARLENTGNSRGFWRASPGHFSGSWLQVDVGAPKQIVGVITQGRPNGAQWVTSYKILYGNVTSNLKIIQNQQSNEDLVFQGNRDRNSKVTNMFPHPITARYFRLLVVTYERVPALRLEYLTC